jgi:hypothetical protein
VTNPPMSDLELVYVQLLYSRLLKARQISRELMKDRSCPWVANPTAVELGINDSSWGSTAAAPVCGTRESTELDHFYRFLLNCIEKLFDGELDQSAFEDYARVTFGTQAYQLFTIDKVINALNKQVSLAGFIFLNSRGVGVESWRLMLMKVSDPNCRIRWTRSALVATRTKYKSKGLCSRPDTVSNQGSSHGERGRECIRGDDKGEEWGDIGPFT